MGCKLLYKNREFDTQDELLDYMSEEDDVVNDLEDKSEPMLQDEETHKVSASPQTIAKVKEFIKRIGVKLENVRDIVVDGKHMNANAVADFTKQLIQIVDGKEDVAITEEAMHFAVEILEQTNPRLFKQMMNEVGKFEIYDSVLYNPTYRQLYQKEGRVDVHMMKKEAVGKILAAVYINKSEHPDSNPQLAIKATDWLDQLLEFFRGLFTKAGFRPFEEAAELIDSDQLEGVQTEGVALQAVVPNPKQSEAYNKLVDTHNKISLTYSPTAKKDVYSINGKEVKRRVSDKTHEWGERKFRNADLTKDEYQDLIETTKKEKGTLGHADMEAVFHRYVDDNGYRRVNPEPMPKSVLAPENQAFITKMDAYMKEMLDTYPEGTRFRSETRIYDPSQDEAGTMDFVAIFEDGQIDIKDWKFMDINPEKNSDVPWYKKDAFNIQIGEYKKILKNVYGVTKFRQTRAIPIRASYKYFEASLKQAPVLKNIVFGNVNPKLEEDLTLVPVATEDESTGNIQIDALIKKLNALHDRLSKEKVAEGRRDIKKDKLNTLEKAIRVLQIQGKTKELIISANQIIGSIESNIKKLREQLETSTDVEAIGIKLLDDYDFMELFKDIHTRFKNVEISDEDREKLKNISERAGSVMSEIKEEAGLREQVGEILVNGVDIKNVNAPEKIVGFYSKNLRSFSQAKTKATQALYKWVSGATNEQAIKLSEEAHKIEKLKANVEKEAKSKGIEIKPYLTKLLNFDDKGRWLGNLIGKYNPEFYTKLKQAQKDGDAKWIKANINMAEYEAWYVKRAAETIAWESDQVYDATDEEANKAEQQRRIANFHKAFKPSNDTAFTQANDQLYRYPLDSWLSPKYTELKDSPALLAFYTEWQEKMKESLKMGMVEARGYSTFVPNIRKSSLEKLFFGTKEKGAKSTYDYLSHFALHADDAAIDPITNKPVDNIQPLYIYDLAREATDKEGKAFEDYSQKSDDLFKIMYLWSDEMLRFDLLSKIEDKARILQSIEQSKLAIASVDKVTGEESHVENTTNLEYYNNFMKYNLYNTKYTEKSDASVRVNVGKYVGGVNATSKKLFGFEILPKPTNDFVDVSASKTIEGINRYFQAKVLGGSFPSALTNFLGGTANALINSGKFMDAGDIVYGQARMISGKFNDEEGKKIAGLIDYVLPLTEDEKRWKGQELSVNNAVSNLSSDALFYLQRKSERFVQIPIFIAFAKNTMVENGELVNIREYVRNKLAFGSRFQLPTAERKALEKQAEKEIKELQDTRSIIKTAAVVNDRLQIPGVDRVSPTLYNFRNRVQQFTKDALGNMDPQDIYQYRMNILFKSAMMFKNWIPRMADVRFGELRYEVGKDDWEYGRYRMMFNGLFSNLLSGAQALIGISSGKEQLIEKAKKLYIIKQAEFGTDEKFLNEGEFVDMYTKAIQQTMQEVLVWLSIIGMMMALSHFKPDDDDELKKGSWKYALRLADRARDELSFFYNPKAMASIANGSMFPALGVFIDLEQFAQNGLKDFGYTLLRDEAGQKKTHTSKYLFKALPITKEITTYLGLFSKDIADEFGLSVSTQARRN
jgi:hypothetical protein